MTNIDPSRRDEPVGDYDMDAERVVEQDAAAALDGPQVDPADEEAPADEDEVQLEAEELGLDEDRPV